MTEQEALDWMVHKAVMGYYNEVVLDKKCDDEWKVVVQDRIRALIPLLKRRGMSCLIEAEAILKE